MAIPTLVQHRAFSTNPTTLSGSIGFANSATYKFPIPNPLLSGNLGILTLGFLGGITLSSITGAVNGSISTTPAVAANDASNMQWQSFLLPNLTAGQETFTVVFGSATNSVVCRFSEFNNVATASPADGHNSATNLTNSGSGIAVPSFTPGTSGDLIYCVVAGDNWGNAVNPTGFTPGGSLIMLDADIAWRNGNGIPVATSYFVQSSAAAITPTMTPTGDTTNTYNCLAIALKSASAGNPKPTGIHIDRLCTFTSDTTPATGTWKFQIPCTGNLRVLLTTEPNTRTGGFTQTVTGIVDSDSHTWTKIEPTTGEPQLWYAANVASDTNATTTLTFASSGGNEASWWFFDISGAATSPIDVSVGVALTAINGATTITSSPSITPTTSNGLVIATIGIDVGPGLSLTSPSGGVFDLATYTGENGNDLMESADGIAHIYNTGTSALNFSWTCTAHTPNNYTGLAVAFKAPSSAAPTWGWQTGDDKERLPASPPRTDWAQQWFVRSPNPVPARWLPITGMEDRPPMPSKRPDDSSIESPETTFFMPSPNPVPTRWLPITGEEDRPPHPNRILAPDQPYPWFVRSPNPVPGIWLPTTGEEDRPPAQKRPPDEPGAYFRSPKSFPAIWLPTTGEEDRPPNPNRVRAPDEPFPWFVRSPNPVPTIWLPQWEGWERPKRIDLDPSGTAFVRQFVATVPISGIAWYVPGEDKERLPPVPPDASLTAFSFKTPAAVNTIAGMAWFNPPETRLPPVSGDPYAVQDLPFFIVPPLQRFFAQTNADDFSPLKAIQPADIAISWTPKVFAASVGISGIAWYAPYADRERLPKASPDASLTSFSFKTPAVINTIAGMAWHNPPETRLPPVLGDPYGVQTIPFFIEPPLLTFMASANAEDFNPLPIFKFEEKFLAFTPQPSAAPVTPISGIAWTSPPETRPPPVRGDPYAVQTLPWFIAPPLFTFMASGNAEDFNPLQKTIPTLDGSVFPFRLIAPPVGVSGVAWWRQTEVYVGPPPPQLDYVVSWNQQFITPPAAGLLLLRTLMGTGL